MPGDGLPLAVTIGSEQELVRVLEQALEFIDTDELLEITPKNLRIRKKILDGTARYRAKRNASN
jgi:predicted membrane GTPase involved in stress response